MIANQNLIEFPVFGSSSVRQQPDEAKYSAGFVNADVLPYEWTNWLFNKSSAAATELNKGVRSIEAELNNVVTGAGLTPAEGTDTQVKSAITAMIEGKTGNLANLQTTAKNNLVAAQNEVNANLNAHAEETGTGAHGATEAATASQIMARDSNGKAYAKTGATADNPVITKTDELANFTTLYNALFPVGFVYTQYPGCKSPTELNMPGTWEELKFGGAFFRSVGGNAKPFTDPFEVTWSNSGKTATFNNGFPTGLEVGDILIIDDEYREVATVSGNVVTIATAFTGYAEKTTVIIGQKDMFKNHAHAVAAVWQAADGAYDLRRSSYRGSAKEPTTSVGGIETRPLNITSRLWKRIN